MAEAPADPDRKDDLEGKILQALQEAGSPTKTAQLVVKCQVSRKELNQVLYRMKSQSKVILLEPATWSLADAGPGAVVPFQPAESARSCALKRPQDMASVPQMPGSSPTQLQEEIYRLLADRGPQRALVIAQVLGMKTARDVNPALYAMRNRHQLSLDEGTRLWAIYVPEGSRRKNQTTECIYQKSTVNMIFQNGPNSCISITNSKDIQIEPVRATQGDTASGDSVPLAPASAWSPQNIHMWKCKQVQLGNYNTFHLHGAFSPPESPQEPSMEAQMDKPGPRPGGDETQGVQGETQLLGHLAINKEMTVSSAGPKGDNSKNSGGLGERRGIPRSPRPPPGGNRCFLEDIQSGHWTMAGVYQDKARV
ncbi:PREDICTED: z-DNA-binding protein 1 [Elephantulus edwardii]|uniref:z-DNA-binding protein 1 n=1 Tax=Elephantulus edwardii TaxID=28737 RepID=UPI0003F063D5|nr:PREDICTED: z-DNA-binding protein 1 [Elephantulus edwardii]